MIKTFLKIRKNFKLKKIIKIRKYLFSDKKNDRFEDIKNTVYSTNYEKEQIIKIQKELENEKLRNKNFNYQVNPKPLVKNVFILLALYILYEILTFIEIKKTDNGIKINKIRDTKLKQLNNIFAKMMEMKLYGSRLNEKNQNLKILLENFLLESNNYISIKKRGFKIQKIYLLKSNDHIFRLLSDGSLFISKVILKEFIRNFVNRKKHIPFFNRF